MSQSLNKITVERNQRALLALVSEPGNDICADCKAWHPRWASHNLGIFICMNCASVHRKMGTHISKVKSITLDSWTKEQVEFMKQHGNVRSNAHYNPDETRHPPPTNMIDSERDSDLEKYIRAKYEYKSFVSRSSQVAALLGPSRSTSSNLSSAPTRSQTVTFQKNQNISLGSPAPPAVPPKTPISSVVSASMIPSNTTEARSASQPVFTSMQQPSQPSVQPPTFTSGWTNPVNPQQTFTMPSFPSSFATSSTFPPTSASQPIPVSTPNTLLPPSTNLYGALSVNSGSPFQSLMNQQSTGMPSNGISRSMSLNMGLSTNVGLDLNPSLNGSGTPSFQSPHTGFGYGTPASVHSPNPFLHQPLPTGPSTGTFGMSGMTSGQQSQLQPSLTPFNPSPFQPSPSPSFPQSATPQLQPSPMFQPQPLGQAPPTSANPFLQSQRQVQMPMSAPSAFGMGLPSPFGQLQAQQQQQMYTRNPFNGWQEGQQGNYTGQQWNGM
ncbi:ArfGap-domain-containing protein [Sparassis crispa]|uniref:ArfGap-domain-containing protein n=1 Tax=Sparassis crispa TaxID=139825 RepID=A0A401GN27_9APHY|nr:ArfGap-domain-containing protein [Sparassis crispa]GBE83616.1 ArfGap-domain-containing protein [Sparassis crispa]